MEFQNLQNEPRQRVLAKLLHALARFTCPKKGKDSPMAFPNGQLQAVETLFQNVLKNR
jgi:hypothetical protein